MTKEKVILIRDTLKAGKNLPLTITTNNNRSLISEVHKLRFTKWDDDNGVLYQFRLRDPKTEGYGYALNDSISVIAVDYEDIDAIELLALPLNTISDVADSISATTSSKISDNAKAGMINAYKNILNPDRVGLTMDELTDQFGSIPGTNYDDAQTDLFLNGRFKETHGVKAYNKSIEKEVQEYNDTRGDEPIDLVRRN